MATLVWNEPKVKVLAGLAGLGRYQSARIFL